MHSFHEQFSIRNFFINITIFTNLWGRLSLSFFFLLVFFFEKIHNIRLYLNWLFLLLLLLFLFWLHFFYELIDLLIIFKFLAFLFLLKFLFLLLNIIIILNFKAWEFFRLRILLFIFLIIKCFVIRSTWNKILILWVMLAMFSESFFGFLELRWFFWW